MVPSIDGTRALNEIFLFYIFGDAGFSGSFSEGRGPRSKAL
jgi:hypothetical protein